METFPHHSTVTLANMYLLDPCHHVIFIARRVSWYMCTSAGVAHLFSPFLRIYFTLAPCSHHISGEVTISGPDVFFAIDEREAKGDRCVNRAHRSTCTASLARLLIITCADIIFEEGVTIELFYSFFLFFSSNYRLTCACIRACVRACTLRAM